jgi:hypothetical protein
MKKTKRSIKVERRAAATDFAKVNAQRQQRLNIPTVNNEPGPFSYLVIELHGGVI